MSFLFVGMANDMNKMAQQIWSMLDNMAAEDPASYRKFIDKQLKEGKEAMKPPSPYLCVQTTVREESADHVMFINIMEWQRIPAPKTDEDPIPTFGGPIYNDSDKDVRFKCVSVAFHPSILDEHCREDSSTKSETHLLIGLAIDYLQAHHKVTISRNYMILPKNVSCKGSPTLASQSLVHKLEGTSESFEKQLHDLESVIGPVATLCKDDLLKEMSSLNCSNEEIHDVRLPNIAGPGSSNKSHMIEELSSTSTVLQKPEFELNVDEESSASCRVMKLTIKLPGVSSAKECELDISDDDVYLLVPEKYELTLNLPSAASSEDGTAQFIKKSSSLLIQLPIKE